MDVLLQSVKTLNNNLSILRTNPYLSASINLFLVLYAGLAAPNLPASIAGLFEYPVFKILILTLVMVLVQGKNWNMAILIAMGFSVSMMTLSRYRTASLVTELSGLENSSDENSSDENSSDENSSDENSSDENSSDENSAVENSAVENSAVENSAVENSPVENSAVETYNKRDISNHNVSKWNATAGVNNVTLRGYSQTTNNVDNLLPGGHNDMMGNGNMGQVHTQGQLGYAGQQYASYGTPNRQL